MGGAQSTNSEGGSVASDGGGGEGSVRSVATTGSSDSSGSPHDATAYVPPTAPIRPLAHYVFLVHGWLGNDLEMGALSLSFRDLVSPTTKDDDDGAGDATRAEGAATSVDRKARRRSSFRAAPSDDATREELTHARAAAAVAEGVVLTTDGEASDGGAGTDIVVHSVKCNVGRTNDGIRRGGTRLAREIADFVAKDAARRIGDRGVDGDGDGEGACGRNATYSIVGNSLGGLYARYAVSLLPYRIPLRSHGGGSAVVTLHPNVFCTTATPHLGVSRHTYLPLPRLAEAAVGAGMGRTGRDLFRLNSGRDLGTAAAEAVVGGVADGVRGAIEGAARRLSVVRGDDVEDENDTDGDDGEEDAACVVRDMCLEERFLAPLRCFRRRVAYANAYGTDFQVPTETAAFLHERSGVGHFVVASRGDDNDAAETDGDTAPLPSHVVAVVRTEPTPRTQSPPDAGADELLRMSQSLDALGWTKVFVDVRDRMPVPLVAKPHWMRPAFGSLDDLVRARRRQCGGEGAECILTSLELARSTAGGDTFNFPMGHTVMIANSKSEGYTKANGGGRPVMDKLAEEMVNDVLEFV